MIKEGLEYLINNIAAKPEDRIQHIDGAVINIDNQGHAHQLHLEEEGRAQDELVTRTLSSLVDYIKSDLDTEFGIRQKLFLHVVSENKVVLKSPLWDDGQREELAMALAILPKITYGQYMEQEEFLIMLNSMFRKDDHRDQLVAFAGNVREEGVKETSDDGFSQQASVKRGIASISNELVPNPVILTPFRTFVEVDQVPSEFVFRMKNGPLFALYEADGGAWRNQAMKNIAAYLDKELKEEIASGFITLLV